MPQYEYFEIHSAAWFQNLASDENYVLENEICHFDFIMSTYVKVMNIGTAFILFYN